MSDLPPTQEPRAVDSAADDVQAAARRRSSLVAGIRHDVKHSQHVARVALRRLFESVEDSKARSLIVGIEEALDEIISQSQKGLEILALGIDEIEPHREPVALDEILLSAEKARLADAERMGIRLRSIPTSVIVSTDRDLVQRCIGNLVTNAIKHSKARRIVIGVRRSGQGCTIVVCDDGQGLPADIARRIAVDESGLPTGRGLGLWITRSFARLLGGTLQAKSAPGRGTRFSLALPGPTDRMGSRPRIGEPGEFKLEGKVVVILDDDADALTEASILLRRRGATVIGARNQIDFWAEIQQLATVPSLFILDFILSPERADRRDATTASCIAALRSRYRSKLKAVVVTSNPSHPVLRTVGAIPVFEKPMTDELLGHIVKATGLAN